MQQILNRNVICDGCGKEFRVKKPKSKKHKDGLEGLLTIFYIQCKHCKKKYVTFVENKQLKEMIRERKSIYSSIRFLDAKTEEGQAEIESRFKKVEELDSKIKLRTNSLKFYFSKYV